MSQLRAIPAPGHDPIDSVLAELHELAPATRCPDPALFLDRVTVRARSLRRGRRLIGLGAGALAVVTVSAFAVPLLTGADGTGRTPAPAGSVTPIVRPTNPPTRPQTDRPTSTPSTRGRQTMGVLPLTDAPELLYLAPADAGDLVGHTMSRFTSHYARSNGPARMVAVRIGPMAPSGGVPADRATWPGQPIQAGLTVSGPNTGDPVSPTIEKNLREDRYTVLHTVKVRGTTGRTVIGRRFVPGQINSVSWQEPGTGNWWEVAGFSLTEAQLVAAADTLKINGDRIDPARLPAGFVALDHPEDAAANDRDVVTTSWRARFRSAAPGATRTWTLTVSSDPYFYGRAVETAGGHAPGSVRLVDLDGTTGYLEDRAGPTLTWARDGLYFELGGDLHPAGGASVRSGLTPEQEVDIARHLVHVAPDDPRLAPAATSARGQGSG